MYPEFIVIYILLAVLFIMQAAALVLLIVLMKKTQGTNASTAQNIPAFHNSAPAVPQYCNIQTGQPAPAGGDVVFCKKCAAEYPASGRFCPNCGTPR